MSDVLQRLHNLQSRITSTFGTIMKRNSAKKVQSLCLNVNAQWKVPGDGSDIKCIVK